MRSGAGRLGKHLLPHQEGEKEGREDMVLPSLPHAQRHSPRVKDRLSRRHLGRQTDRHACPRTDTQTPTERQAEDLQRWRLFHGQQTAGRERGALPKGTAPAAAEPGVHGRTRAGHRPGSGQIREHHGWMGHGGPGTKTGMGRGQGWGGPELRQTPANRQRATSTARHSPPPPQRCSGNFGGVRGYLPEAIGLHSAARSLF